MFLHSRIDKHANQQTKTAKRKKEKQTKQTPSVFNISEKQTGLLLQTANGFLFRLDSNIYDCYPNFMEITSHFMTAA